MQVYVLPFLNSLLTKVFEVKLKGNACTEAIDIYKMSCICFRDLAIWPHQAKLLDVLTKGFTAVERSVMGPDMLHRLNQMCAVLAQIGAADDERRLRLRYLLGLLRHQVRENCSSSNRI